LDFVIPPEFWGNKNNKTVIYKMVKIFIERRHFEELSLHEVLQGFKVCLFIIYKKSYYYIIKNLCF
jgi:hypothetical protein